MAGSTFAVEDVHGIQRLEVVADPFASVNLRPTRGLAGSERIQRFALVELKRR